MKLVSSFKVALFLFLLAFCLSEAAFAYIPEPKSGGVYFQSKGTKAAEDYERNAGSPTYEYGKGLQWGPLNLKPNFGYIVEWDSNTFYAPHDPKDDVIQNLNTDTRLELPFGGGQHLLSGAYITNTQIFDRFTSQNHTDQTLQGDLKLNFVPFTLDAEDTFRKTVSRADTEFTARVPRYENTFNSVLEIPFSSFFLENEILDFDEDYRSPENNIFDYNEFTVYQRVGYDWTPSTQLLAEYAYIHVDYPNVGNRDGDGNQVMLGMRGNFTERISYQAWGGAQFRNYDDSTRPDFHDFVFRGAIQYQPSELSTFTLKGERKPQESVFDGQSYYVLNRVQLNWRRQLAEHIFFNTHGILDHNEYSRITRTVDQDETRRDYVWEAGAGLEYKMPNDLITFILQYKVASRNSNINNLNYDDHNVSLGVKAAF